MRDAGRGTRAGEAAVTTPDGVSYGSRWSRAKRETTGSNVRDGSSTPDGPRMGSRIKYQAAWIPSATAAAVGKSERVHVSGDAARAV